jgi:hypothetical protein
LNNAEMRGENGKGEQRKGLKGPNEMKPRVGTREETF